MLHHPSPEQPACATVAIHEWMKRLVLLVQFVRCSNTILYVDQKCEELSANVWPTARRMMMPNEHIHSGAIS